MAQSASAFLDEEPPTASTFLDAPEEKPSAASFLDAPEPRASAAAFLAEPEALIPKSEELAYPPFSGVVGEPKMVAPSGFLSSVAGEAGKLTLQQASGIANEYEHLGVVTPAKPFLTSDQPEFDATQVQLNDLREERARTQEGGGGLPDPREIELSERLKMLGRPPSAERLSGQLSDAANRTFQYFGADPESKNALAQIGRGGGAVLNLAPSMAAGGAGLPVIAAQGASGAYAEAYGQAIKDGKSDTEAQQAASQSALKTAPGLALYMVGGKLAGEAGAALMKEATPAAKALIGAAFATGANVTVGSTLKAIDGQDWKPTLESLTTDALFGMIHGVGEWGKASDDQRQKAAWEVARRAEEPPQSQVTGAIPEGAERALKTVTSGREPSQPSKEMEPQVIDGLLISRDEFARLGANLDDLTEVNKQLANFSPEAIKEGEERKAARGQSPPPASGEASPVTTESSPAETTEVEGNTPEVPTTPAAEPITDPALHQAADTQAKNIAASVTKGQGDLVQTAAYDAAIAKARAAMAKGVMPSSEIMRKAAKAAAGGEVKGQPTSLDAEQAEGQTVGDTVASEEPTPAQAAAKADMIDAVQKQVEALPEKIQGTAKAFLEAAQNGESTSLRDLGEKLGVSQQTVANHLKAMRDAFKGLKEEGYSVGPGAASISEQLGESLTGIKNASTEAGRAAAGLPERDAVGKKAFPELWDKTLKAFDDDPNVGKRLVDELGEKTHPLTDDEAAILTHELGDRQQEYDEAAHKVSEAQTPDEQSAAKVRLADARERLHEVYDASEKAGTENARGLNARKLLIKSDYSLAHMEMTERASRGKPLTEEQLTEVKKQFDALEATRKEAEKASGDVLDTETQHFVEATINELGKSYLEKPAYGKKVFDIARGIVDRWKEEAKSAHDDLKKALGNTLAGVPNPAIVLHVAKILRAKIGEFGLKKAEAFAEMVDEFGPKVKDHLEAGWKKAHDLISSEGGDRKAKEIAGKGMSKQGEKTPVEAAAAAKAEKVAGEKLSQKTIVDHVRALINSGEHDTNKLMAKTTEALKEHFPDLTEREVRRAFVDYGKKIFPSKDAVETEIRENKQIVKIQEDINREIEGQKGIVDPETGKLIGAEKQGYQRDKATQKVRDLIKQRNELLKKRTVDSPEKLASEQARRKTALENAIADTDRELKTGEKRAKTEAAPDDAHNEQLRAELQAMRDKVKEIDAEQNPGKTEAEKQEAALQKQLDNANAELAGTKEKAQPKEWKALSQKAEDLRAQLDSVRQLKKELEVKPGKTLDQLAAEKAQKGVDAAAVAVDRWDRILKGEINREPGKAHEAKSQLEEDLRSEADAMRKAADEIRRRENPTDKEKTQLKAIEKAIAEYERKTKALDFSTKGKMQGPDTEKIAAAKEAKAAAKKVFDELAKDQRYNDARLQQIEKRTTELQTKMDAGDFSRPEKKVSPAKNQAVQDAEAKLQNLKDTFDTRQRQIEYNNRPEWERNFDTLSGTIRGGKLTRIKTLAKLASFSVQNLVFRMPLREVFGGIVSKLPGFKELAQKADVEGGFSSAGMRKLYTKTFTQGLKDARMAISPALNILSRGKLGDITSRNPLKTLYGEKPRLEPRFYDIPQMVHEMKKSPLLRGAFELYSEKLFKNAGRDINSATPQDPFFQKAYAAAEREILMNNNSVANMVHSGIEALERQNKETGKVSFQAKAGSAALKTLTAFTKVATNHFVQTFNAALGAPIGIGRLIAAKGIIPSYKTLFSSTARLKYSEGLAKGLLELHPDDANSIMRQIKDGAPGAAFVTLGVIAPQLFGGLDAGRKRKDDEPKFGEMKVGGVCIPRYVVFASPFLLAGQIGATFTQAAQSFRRKGDTEPRGAAEGALTTAAALAQTGPLVNEGARLSKIGEPNQRGQYLKDWVRSNFVPGILTEIAEAGDKDALGNATKRDPQNFLDNVKMELPYFRNQVPPKTATPRASYRRR